MDTQPGQVLIPHDNDAQPSQSTPQSSVQSQPAVSADQPQPAAAAATPTQDTTTADASDTPANASDHSLYNSGSTAPDTDWQYAQDADSGLSTHHSSLPDDVTWSAAEFLEHQKGARWYGLLFLAGLVLAGLDFLVLHDIISTAVIIFVTIMFAAYAGHKPRTQQYHLSPQGLQIGEKLYVFQSFKNFSVAEEGAHISIVFMPLQRFMPLLTVYLTPDIEDRVVDYLSNFLPLEQHRPDVLDGLLRRIKF